METRELLKKIKSIPINTGSLAEQLLAGNFSSVFKGQGFEFDEIRHYQYGDDIRSIDWNASARFGTPFIKLYREERDLTILILLDTSASMFRERNAAKQDLSSGQCRQPEAANNMTPYEQAVFAAALIAFSAERKSQRVGALLFDSDIHKVFLPRKGRHHLMALVGGILKYQELLRQNIGISSNEKQVLGSNVAAALAGAARLLKRRSLVVLVSDFLSINWEDQLASLCSKHDVISLRISDPADIELPDIGLTVMEDPETGVRLTAPGIFPTFREAWKEWHIQRAELWENICRRTGAAYLDLPVTTDAASALYRFFSAGRHEKQKRRSIG